MNEKQTKDLLEIENLNYQKISDEICTFIIYSVKRFQKDGLILGLSGGIDSTVIAYLAVRALGRKRVFCLIMPDKDSEPENIRDAQEVTKILKTTSKEIDLTPILEKIGIYNLIFSKIIKSKTLLLKFLEIFRRRTGTKMIHSLGSLGLSTPDKISQISTAVMIPKLRLRSLLLYYYGAKKNFLVAGTTNKTEYLIGHYDKYGDGACDIEPIRNLYKVQVRKLAEYLKVPEKIIKKSPSHDLFAGSIITDEKLIGMSFEEVDSILYGIEKGLRKEEIAEELILDAKLIDEVQKAMENEKIRREMPFSP